MVTEKLHHIMFGTRSQKILTYMIQEIVKNMSQHMYVGLPKFGIHWLSRGEVITIFIVISQFFW